MKLQNEWQNQETIKWLREIITARFDVDLSLNTSNDRCIHLTRKDEQGIIKIVSDPVTFTRSDSDIPYSTWNALAEGWDYTLSHLLPAPGMHSHHIKLIEKTSYGYHINYDILGLTYWMLSRQEEVDRTDLDSHGRFPASSSHAVKHGYLERPIVDEWLYILGQVIQRAWPQLRLKRNHFSIKVSHDVDVPSRYGFASAKKLIRTISGDIIKRHDFKNATIAPWIYLNTKQTLHLADPFNTFDSLQCHIL